MNNDNAVFWEAWRKQVQFLKSSATFHDAIVKSLKVHDYVLIPYFPELIYNKNYSLDLLPPFSLDDGNEKAIVFIVSDSYGNKVGEMLVELISQKNELKSTLWINERNLTSFNRREFINSFKLWAKNIVGLNVFFEPNQGLVESNLNTAIDSYDKNFVPNSLILTAGPSISTIESYYAYDAASNGWNSNWSKYLTEFENEFAKYVGAKYALATSSCTGALQISLMALDIGPGDEVIVPDETWVATANAVRYVGAIPVFADIEIDTWNIDVKSIESLITSKTKAIMAVHMYGHPSRMTPILELAKKYGLRVVEDAAPAIGAEWQGKRCGSFGDFAAFSFQGAKLLVTGEGGMLVTSDEKLYEKAKKIWDQGRNPSKVFWIDADGVKFKMSNVQAAVGLGQLERADELIAMKRRVFSWYEDGLSMVPHITLNKEVEGARSIYWMTSLFLDENASLSRDDLMKELKKRNIDSRPVFPAISQYPIWPRKQDPQPIAMRVGQRAMNLPSGVCLTKDEVMYTCKNIIDILNK
jgi:dTDP-4-amino-4,6-dideoxygalactose transaminase